MGRTELPHVSISTFLPLLCTESPASARLRVLKLTLAALSTTELSELTGGSQKADARPQLCYRFRLQGSASPSENQVSPIEQLATTFLEVECGDCLSCRPELTTSRVNLTPRCRRTFPNVVVDMRLVREGHGWGAMAGNVA